MKNLVLALFISSVLIGCNPTADTNYFKLTLTDEPNPTGLLPECMEVSSDGKMVILTNRFNEGNEIYQQTHFIELNKQQLDSVKMLMRKLGTFKNSNPHDGAFSYKIKLDAFKNKQRKSQLFLASNADNASTTLFNYCKSLPEYNKLYALKHSHYFNTDEICLEQKAKN